MDVLFFRTSSRPALRLQAGLQAKFLRGLFHPGCGDSRVKLRLRQDSLHRVGGASLGTQSREPVKDVGHQAATHECLSVVNERIREKAQADANGGGLSSEPCCSSPEEQR